MPTLSITGLNSSILDVIQEQTGLTQKQSLDEYAGIVAQLNNCRNPNDRLASYSTLVLPDRIETNSQMSPSTLVLVPTNASQTLYNTLEEIDPNDIKTLLAFATFAGKNKMAFSGGGISAGLSIAWPHGL